MGTWTLGEIYYFCSLIGVVVAGVRFVHQDNAPGLRPYCWSTCSWVREISREATYMQAFKELVNLFKFIERLQV